MFRKSIRFNTARGSTPNSSVLKYLISVFSQSEKSLGVSKLTANFVGISERDDPNYSATHSYFTLHTDMNSNSYPTFIDDKENPKWKEIARKGREYSLRELNNDNAANELALLMKDLI